MIKNISLRSDATEDETPQPAEGRSVIVKVKQEPQDPSNPANPGSASWTFTNEDGVIFISREDKFCLCPRTWASPLCTSIKALVMLMK